MNLFVGIGRVTKDLNLQYTQNGKAYTKFTLAINRVVKTQDGRDADFINATAWGDQAENMTKYLKKGSLIAIRARIQTGSYQGQDGQMRYTTDVVCDSVQFLEPKGGNNGGFNNDPYNTEPSFNTIDISDDDLPF